jgi:putative DNA primase/helicase
MSIDLHAAMAESGLRYNRPLVANGKLHRIRVEGDHNRNSWYVLFPGSPLAGVFGCWKRDIKETWCERNGQLSKVEWDRVRQKWQQAESERERTEQERHAAARKAATWIWEKKSKPVVSHLYLERKGVGAHGELRVNYRRELVLPLRDSKGILQTLQFIAPHKRYGEEGDKRDKNYFPGGKRTGAYYSLADKADGPLIIAEGYATGASLHEATGFSTICAMDCGNFLAVAQALRSKWPQREIILCADNDQWTKDNPGLSKATQAAKAIGASLAVPEFTGLDVNGKPTDFNDLRQLAGLEKVREQIESATVPEETAEEAVDRLSKLTALDYEPVRVIEAGKLGKDFRVSMLDKLVEAKRPKTADRESEGLQGATVEFPILEPWPGPVDGAATLDAASGTITGYVALRLKAFADAVALWVAHTHCFRLFTCSPRLNGSAPTMGCGKTVLRDVIATLVSKPLSSDNGTVAVFFRLAQEHQPTLLIDEVDAWLRENEELRGLLNAGHRKGTKVLRCEGDNNKVRGFDCFCPVALFGIGALPATLHDRSIVIPLERAKLGEIQKEFDPENTQTEKEIARKLAQWCSDNRDRIEAAASKVELPSGAYNRVANNWRPLFAIAEAAGGDWPKRVEESYRALMSREDGEAQGIGTMLLEDIRAVFGEIGIDRIFSAVLVEKLVAITDRPWPEAHRGKPISETWLARKLKTFGVSSQKLRMRGEQPKQGYYLNDFQEPFTRYIPKQGESKWNTGTKPVIIDRNAHSEVEHHKTVFHFENSIPSNKINDCSTVPLAKAGIEQKEAELLRADLL